MVPGQEAKSDSLRKCFSIFYTITGLKNEFELSMVNEPSVFVLLRFDCILLSVTPDSSFHSFHVFFVSKGNLYILAISQDQSQ